MSRPMMDVNGFSDMRRPSAERAECGEAYRPAPTRRGRPDLLLHVPGELRRCHRTATMRPGPQPRPGNHRPISRAADSGPSEPWTRFSVVVVAKSPRIEPGW